MTGLARNQSQEHEQAYLQRGRLHHVIRLLMICYTMTKCSSHPGIFALGIQVSGISFEYSGGTPVLSISHWELASGSRVFLHGPSGSGKSTLLNLLCGMLVPSAGDIRVDGTCISDLSGRRRDRFRARHIGVVFQQFSLIPYLSVGDNLRLAQGFARQRAASDKTLELIRALRLPDDCLGQRTDRLSVGQQQRVAIARALINTPSLLIIDEPTSALDPEAGERFMDLLDTLTAEQGTTTVFASHDLSLAGRFAERVDMRDLNRACATHNAA